MSSVYSQDDLLHHSDFFEIIFTALGQSSVFDQLI